MTPSTPEFVDRFVDDRAGGQVIGSSPVAGITRRGIDAERVVSIDHGALRIGPLVKAGWGRAQVSYGPYERRDGLVLAVLLLNGHNTSQSQRLGEPLRGRLERWICGHDRRRAVPRRAWQWLRYKRKRYMIRRLRWWWQLSHGSVDEFDENLAVGWFGSEVQSEPGAAGNPFVMHAGLGNNGELWVRTAGQMLPVASLVQNVPMCYVAILRERGAAYYLGSVPRANAAGELPRVRPLGVDPFADEPSVYAGLQQSALGQIGFRTDTRVYGVQVAHVGELANWFGTAHVADSLLGDGVLAGAAAEAGGHWSVVSGEFKRTSDGAVALEASSTAVVHHARRLGVVHCIVELPDTGGGAAGLVWRADGEGSCLRFLIDRTGCRAELDRDGVTSVLAESRGTVIRPGSPNSVQVIDHGGSATFAVNGRDALGAAVEVTALEGAGVGICTTGASGARFRHFEAHPVDVDLGTILDLPQPWYEVGDTDVVRDDFAGPAGLDLDGQVTSDGSSVWRQLYGRGRIVTTGGRGAIVDASVHRRNPGSMAYTIDWDAPDFADVAVDVTPPGRAPGEGESGRGGIILWQDKRNFLTISMYVDDNYDGASIAIFSHLDGFEDIYDAVWSMVGKKLYYGQTDRLRVVCDGMRVMIFINDEPVLYRALTDLYPDRNPLSIREVGLVVNWEWGDDTGSRLANFVAKTRRVGS